MSDAAGRWAVAFAATTFDLVPLEEYADRDDAVARCEELNQDGMDNYETIEV